VRRGSGFLGRLFGPAPTAPCGAGWELALWPRFAEAAVSFTFDDGADAQFSDGAALLEACGFRGTFFVPLAAREYPVDFEAARRCAAAGHEIGSHTVTHPHLPKLSDAELERELGESAAGLETKFGRPVPTLAYPYFEYDARVKAAAARHYVLARGRGKRPAPAVPRDRYEVPSDTIRHFNTAEQLRRRVEKAMAVRGWCVHTLHRIHRPMLDEHLAWLREQGRRVWVAPFGAVAAYLLARAAARVEPRIFADRLRLRLITSLDPRLRAPRLSLRVALPAEWKSCRVAQSGAELEREEQELRGARWADCEAMPGEDEIEMRRA
jgi:peptidoglycan/xylan/chitin deacetylase (PgdA/CDA1 family)